MHTTFYNLTWAGPAFWAVPWVIHSYAIGYSIPVYRDKHYSFLKIKESSFLLYIHVTEDNRWPYRVLKSYHLLNQQVYSLRFTSTDTTGINCIGILKVTAVNMDERFIVRHLALGVSSWIMPSTSYNFVFQIHGTLHVSTFQNICTIMLVFSTSTSV